MFFPAERPADPACQELRALHRAMNTPVVAIEQLPVGPASAAVALHRVPDEGVSLTIAIRSVRTGQTVLFTAGEDLLQLGSPSVALDAALSFAESMGFLFDDDEVGSRGARGPVEAARLWRELIDETGEADQPISLEEARRLQASRAEPRPAGRPPADRELEPLWLSEPLETEPAAPRPPPARPRAEPGAGPASRQTPAPGAARAGSPRGSPREKRPPPERPPQAPPTPGPRPAAPGGAARHTPGEGRLRAVLEQTSVERLYSGAPTQKPRLTKFRELPGGPGRRAGDAASAAAPGDGHERRRGPEAGRPEPTGSAAPALEEALQADAPGLRIRLLSRF